MQEETRKSSRFKGCIYLNLWMENNSVFSNSRFSLFDDDGDEDDDDLPGGLGEVFLI